MQFKCNLRAAPHCSSEARSRRHAKGSFSKAGVQAICTLRNRALTLPSRGRATSGFASCRPPLMSNVRRHMTPLETVLITVGGNALLLAVLGYLAKSLLSQLLAKDLKHFETRLTQASAVAAEELQHRLSLVSHEHHVRFTRLHDKQAQ